MDPWKILGWIALALVAWCSLELAARIAAALKEKLSRRIAHWQTRNIPPQEGQRWQQDDAVLEIGQRWPKGHFTVRSGNASWGETDEQWRDRVRNRKLFLISPR